MIRALATVRRPIGTLPPAIAVAPYNTWKLNFHDEFDSVDDIALDANSASGKKWWNGNEQCCMAPSADPRDPSQGGVMFPTPVNGSPVNPYSVANGVLDITLSLNDQLWSSGILTSVDGNGNGFAQQYGYFEMRARFPAGPGTWPAFWMLDQTAKTGGAGGGGEIDIIEQYGQFPTGMCTTLHDWKNADGAGPQACGTTPNDPITGQPINWTDGFHTVAMLWTADMMTFYADDQVYTSSPPLGVFDVPYYILLNLGVGSGWPTDQTPDPSIMEIDYVRVWGQ